MKLVNKIVAGIAAIASIGLLASCGSTSGTAPAAAPVAEVIPPPPAKVTEEPTVAFDGTQLKIELESMLLDNFLVFPDKTASGYYAGKLIDATSTAKVKVTFPAGKYEGLVNELAPDGDHDAFNVFIDGVAYRSYPSDPPLGKYELTTRTPMQFTIDAPKTVEIVIQQNDPNKPNKPGENGMKLDYIVFTKK